MYFKSSIVAVDDSGIILKALESMLGNDYEFHGFSKAQRALTYIMQSTPDLIILDIDMPETNGYEMLDMIRTNDDLKDVPVIFLTSNSDKTYVVKAVQSGADAYVVKPIDKEILIDKINSLL